MPTTMARTLRTTSPKYSFGLQIFDISLDGEFSDFYACSGSAMGAGCGISYEGAGISRGPAHEHTTVTTTVDGYLGVYGTVLISAASGVVYETKRIMVWRGDYFITAADFVYYFGTVDTMPYADAIMTDTFSPKAVCNIEVSGIAMYEHITTMLDVDDWPTLPFRDIQYPARILSREWRLDEYSTLNASITLGGATATAVSEINDFECSNFTFVPALGEGACNTNGLLAAVTDITVDGKHPDTSDLPLYNTGDYSGDRNWFHTYMGYDPGDDDDWKYEASADGYGVQVRRVGGITPVSSPTYVGFPVWFPTMVTMVPRSRFADKDGEPAAITYVSSAQDYADGEYTPATHDDVKEYIDWPVCWSREQHHNVFASDLMQVRVDYDWAVANGQVHTDKASPIRCHALTSYNLTDEPWWGERPFHLSHATALGCWPSSWACGAGVSGTDGAFTVAAGTALPRVTGIYATRHLWRLARLAQPYSVDPAAIRDYDWPITGPNIDLGDDPAEWQALVPTEGMWQFSEFDILAFDLTAPGPGTVTAVISYRSIKPVDNTRQEVASRSFTCKITSRMATYKFDVVAGINHVVIDLACPKENFIPSGERKMWHVDTIDFAFPASGASPEDWTFDDTAFDVKLAATGSTLATHVTANDDRTIGFGAIVDGKKALELLDQYGYAYMLPGCTERTMAHMRYQLAPDWQWPAPDEPLGASYYKPISELVSEINRQAGWTATYTDPTEEDSNKDADGHYLCDTFIWGDLSDEADEDGTLKFAPIVDVVQIVQGIAIKVYHETTLDGRGEGIAKNTSGTERKRNLTGAVVVPGYAACDTDAQGHFFTEPLVEDLTDGYRVGSGRVYIANRNWTTVQVNRGAHTNPALDEGYITDLHQTFEDTDEGASFIQRSPTARQPWDPPIRIADGAMPCVMATPRGGLAVCNQAASGLINWYRSKDNGLTWSGVGSPVNGEYPVATEFNGMQYLVAYTSGVGQLIRRSQDYFATLLPYSGGVTSSLITAQSDAARAAFVKTESDANGLCVVVPYSGTLTVYRSKNDGEDWTS